MENAIIDITLAILCSPGNSCRAIWLQDQSMFRKDAVSVRRQFNY
jgi:hypothetical protein